MAKGHTLLPSTQHTLQEAALWPGTAPQSLQCTLASGTGIPMVPRIHSIQEGSRGHTDYRTTKLHSQPTKSIKNPRGGKYREKPSGGKYREILTEAELANNKGQPANQQNSKT